MAAEYEVNIKLNTQEIKTQLNEIDRVVKDIGKGGRGGGSKNNIGAGIAKQLSLFTADSIFGRGRITGTALKNVKLSWLGAFDEIQDVANTIGGRRSARLLNVRTSWGKAFEGLSKNAKVLELGGLNTQTSWGKALTGLQDNAKVLKLGGINTQTSWGKALTGLQDNAKVLKLGGVNTQTSWGKALTGLQDNAKVLKLGGVNTQTSWTKALTGLQDNAKVLKLGGVNTQTSWTKALTGLQDNAKVLDIQNLNVRTSWGKALEQLGETAEIIAKNAAAARAQFLAGAPIPGLAPGQTAGPARPPVQGAAFPIGGTAGIPGSPEFERALAIGRFRSSPIEGAVNIPGSPLAKKARKERFEQVGLGAGFPLLFGGGAGSILGGGLGGLTGSFGAQIAFSAIGQQVDQFIASVANVGTALTSASGTVEMFREKNLFSSDAVKKHAFELEQQGEMQKLATLLTKDLASQIGVNAVKNFQELGGEVKEFLGTINQLFLAVQSFVAGPLAKLLGAINTVLGGVSTEMQFKNLRGSLTGEAATQFEAIIAEARGTRRLTGRDLRTAQRNNLPTSVPGLLTTAAMQRALQDPRTAALRQTLDVTGQTTLDDTLGGNTAAKAAQRLLESSQRRISILKLETEEIKKITEFKNKIAAAELVSDKRAVARLTRDRELAKLKSNEDKAIARINPKLTEAQQALEKTNIEARGLAQAAEIRAQFERDIALIVKNEQNEAYKKQAELIEANFKMQEKELKKAQALAKSFGDTVKDGFVDSIKAATDETQSLSDALAKMLNRLSDQLLNLAANLAFYGNAQGTLAQGQGLFGSILQSVAPSLFEVAGPGGYKISDAAVPKFRANGGGVAAGRPYIVGERGPELFVPGAQGNIVPNNAMGSANVTVNVDASGSSVEGNSDQAAQLGRMLGAAVQAELVKQKRPGGLLAS